MPTNACTTYASADELDVQEFHSLLCLAFAIAVAGPSDTGGAIDTVLYLVDRYTKSTTGS